MNEIEKNEIARLDPKYKPISAWGYFGYQILFSIPVIGFICLLVFTFSGSNINRRSYARSYWCALLVFIVIAAIMVIISLANGSYLAYIDMIKSMMQPQE